MDSNDTVDQKLLMAHVYGHCDFFKNNDYFRHTNRKMMDGMANHGNRVRRYMDRFGVEQVEEFIDSCMSLDNLIDIHASAIKRHDNENRYDSNRVTKQATTKIPRIFSAKSYMDRYINPPDILAAESRKLQQEHSSQLLRQPQRDVLLFLLENAPLDAWQADILAMLREEAYYFAPQTQTKIMNEGWASYWHSIIMTRQSLSPGDVISYCDNHSGTMSSSPNGLNPYKLGIELFRDIKERWDQGRFGKEYEECDDRTKKNSWNTGAGLGRDKIFEVRRVHNDLTFIDAFLTPEFCRQHNLFQFGYHADSDHYQVESREFPKIKQQLLFNLTNAGRPQIAVRDSNY